jgi:hypothetical protein
MKIDKTTARTPNIEAGQKFPICNSSLIKLQGDVTSPFHIPFRSEIVQWKMLY